MKRWEHFDYEERDEVATLTFSRPERLNSLTFEVYADIRELTDSLRNRQDEEKKKPNRRGCDQDKVKAVVQRTSI